MSDAEIVTRFFKHKEAIERYGFIVEVGDLFGFKIKRKLEDGTIVLSAYLIDVGMLQGFIQGIECLITSDGSRRSKEISVLIENKHAGDCRVIKKKGE